MKNRFAELLGVEYSIIQGGMLQLGFSKLAAAVSNAGAAHHHQLDAKAYAAGQAAAKRSRKRR